MKNNVNSNL